MSDYTAILATALADSGQSVHVWCPGGLDGSLIERDGLTVHRIRGGFGPVGLARLDRQLNRVPRPRTILIQYVPHAFGWKGMNLAFASWALTRRVACLDEVRVMFHEVAFPWVRHPLRHNVLAAVNRVMVAVLLRSCTESYVSIPAWIPLLRQLGAGRMPILWTPIPATIPADPDPIRVAARRSEIVGHHPETLIVGHFGTFGAAITGMLEPILGDLLARRPEVRVLLLGRGNLRFRSGLVGEHCLWSDRIVAPCLADRDAIAEWLRACDLMIQPYPDGVSSRRTTVMAALSNAVPVVTTSGHLTESIWSSGPVAIESPNGPVRLANLAIELLDSPARRTALGMAGQRLYKSRFSIDHTLDALFSPDR